MSPRFGSPQWVGVGTVASMIDKAPDTIGKWVRNKKCRFPKPIYIGKRRAWRLTEIEDWIATQKQRTGNNFGPRPMDASARRLRAIEIRLSDTRIASLELAKAFRQLLSWVETCNSHPRKIVKRIHELCGDLEGES